VSPVPKRQACVCGAQVLIVRGEDGQHIPPLEARPGSLGTVAVAWAGPAVARVLSAGRPLPEWNEHRHQIHECQETTKEKS
jgi:hypothetical protein